MKCVYDKGSLLFSSGKRFWAEGVVGIDIDPGGFGICYGYDGGIATPDSTYWSDTELTADECVALADFMLSRWAAFKSKYADEVHP